MSTEAGKRLLDCQSYHWPLCPIVIGDGECECHLPDAITAIEAEAAEAREKELAECGSAIDHDHGECRSGCPYCAGEAMIASERNEAVATERARITREIAEKIEGDITAVLAIVEDHQHDWQRSGPVSDGHLFCPNCGCHEDEDDPERPPSCEQHPEDY